MTTFYSTRIRSLFCTRCDAIVSAPPSGGAVTCARCGTEQIVAPRGDAGRDGALDTGLPPSGHPYLAGLRAQDGQDLRVPDSLSHLVHDGLLRAERGGEAFEVLRLTCDEVRRTGSPEAAGRAYWLVLTLSNHLLLGRDHRARRAVLETGLDVLMLRRHLDVLRCMLGSSAAAEGDLGSAAAWLAPCAARSGDLERDSALRVATAFVATVRRDYDTVLHLLGSEDEAVPVHDVRESMAAALRANALEKKGLSAAATAALAAYMRRVRPDARRATEAFARLHPQLRMCERSLPAASKTVRARSAMGLSGALTLVAIILVATGLGLAALALVTWADVIATGRLPQPAPGSESNTPGLLLGPAIGAALLLTIGWRIGRGALRNLRLTRDGVPARGVITRIEHTGLSINDVPQVRVHVRVEREGAPAHAASALMFLDPLEASRLPPGAEVALLVDPASPEHVLIER